MRERLETLESLADRFAAAHALWTELDEQEVHTPVVLAELRQLCAEVLAQPVISLDELALKAQVLGRSEGLIDPAIALAALCGDIEHLRGQPKPSAEPEP